jgi:uncharacterized protein YutE (UPF0331/DUF86 family)
VSSQPSSNESNSITANYRGQQSLSRADLVTETTEQRAVERMFENAIQACADLATHIAATDFDFSRSNS